MPPPRTSASQDRPPTPENIQRKQMQLDQPLDEPGSSKLPQQKRQPAALPPPREKSTRKKTVPARYTEGNVYGKKHPVEVEKDILRQRDWKKVVGEESSRPRRQNIPGGVPVPDSVPYYSSDEEGGDDDESVDSEDEAHESPSEEEEEEAVVSRLSREGGVSFLSFLVSKAVIGLATGPGRRTSRQSKRGGVYPCCEVFQRRTEDEGENATRARRG